jgi:CheY-like chemotaxis protein
LRRNRPDAETLLHPPTRPLVFIVDGHEETLALSAVALYAMGLDVLAASDGVEGYSRARDGQPDIIATELSMRTDHAWDFLHRLKQDARTRNIPVVAVSGPIQLALRERAERDGVRRSAPQAVRGRRACRRASSGPRPKNRRIA